MTDFDLYGAAAVTSSGGGEADVVNAACLPALQSLLPPGVAWTREPGTNLTELLTALSYEYQRIKKRGAELFDEIDPRTADELLSELESIYGLTPLSTTSLADRRAALHAKYLGSGSPTKANFEAIAASLGYTVTILTRTRVDIFDCESNCNASIYADEWMFVWDVTTASGDADAELQAAFEALAPRHTFVRFTFT